MRTVRLAVIALVPLLAIAPAQAQTVDGGRGALPVTVPVGYSADVAAPLIVLPTATGS